VSRVARFPTAVLFLSDLPHLRLQAPLQMHGSLSRSKRYNRYNRQSLCNRILTSVAGACGSTLELTPRRTPKLSRGCALRRGLLQHQQRVSPNRHHAACQRGTVFTANDVVIGTRSGRKHGPTLASSVVAGVREVISATVATYWLATASSTHGLAADGQATNQAPCSVRGGLVQSPP
jgi:hypothetical protein